MNVMPISLPTGLIKTAETQEENFGFLSLLMGCTLVHVLEMLKTELVTFDRDQMSAVPTDSVVFILRDFFWENS